MGRHKKTHEDFIKDLIKSNTYYRTLEFSIIGNYIGVDTGIKVKNKYGICFSNPRELLKGHDLSIRSAINKTSYWINMAIEIHGDNYDYSKTIYTHSTEKLIIICKEHGEFKQTSDLHLQGYGCPGCKKNTLRENPNGWTLEGWKLAGKESKNFDSFKVYIIKCWEGNEEFYKIGRTFKTVKKRYAAKTFMPYDYEIIKIVEGEVDFIYNLESKLQNLNKDFKYIPKKEFGGMFECFSKLTNSTIYEY